MSVLADDEWEMVIYDAHKKGQQCGRSYQEIKGTPGSGQCLKLKETSCAKVKIDRGWHKCNFKWGGDSCNDVKTITHIDLGAEQTVDLPDVKFVTVNHQK
jgi:hypothetical protein